MGDRVIASITQHRHRAEACILRNAASRVVRALLSRRDSGSGALHVSTLRAPLLEGLHGGLQGAYSDLIRELLEDAKRRRMGRGLAGGRALGITIGIELERAKQTSPALAAALEEDPHWLAFTTEILHPTIDSLRETDAMAQDVASRVRPRAASGFHQMLRGDEVEVDLEAVARFADPEDQEHAEEFLDADGGPAIEP